MTKFLVSYDDVTQALPPVVEAKLNLTYAAKTHTHPSTAITDFNAAVTALIPPNTGSLTGTYTARPAANTVTAGTIYYPTDIPEMYRSNGTVWVVVGTGGSELGYAESTAMFSTASTVAVDVTGMTVAFIAGERPVLAILRADLAHSVGTATVTALIVVNSVVRGRAITFPAAAADIWDTKHREARVAGLTPGATYTAKVQLLSSIGTSTARITGDATNPMSVSVVTL